MRYRELEKLLLEKGCQIRYAKGSHVMIKFQSLTFTMTRHNNHDQVERKELNRLIKANIINLEG